MNVDSEDPARFSLGVICRSLLARKWLWPADGRSDGFRHDIEELLTSINDMPASKPAKYIWALLHLSSQMPAFHIERGDLTGLVETLPTHAKTD